MTRLALALTLLATPAAACELTSAHVIGYTHHLGATPVQTGWTDSGQRVYGPRFDEGLRLRGGGVTVECGGYDFTTSAYKNSLHNGGMGYSVSLTHDDLSVTLGGLEMRPLAQINYYPDQKENPLLKDTGGVFPTVGISFRYEMTDDLGLFVNAYPTFGRDVSFDSLWVAGVSFVID